jgi:hypothetical protein
VILYRISDFFYLCPESWFHYRIQCASRKITLPTWRFHRWGSFYTPLFSAFFLSKTCMKYLELQLWFWTMRQPSIWHLSRKDRIAYKQKTKFWPKLPISRLILNKWETNIIWAVYLDFCYEQSNKILADTETGIKKLRVRDPSWQWRQNRRPCELLNQRHCREAGDMPGGGKAPGRAKNMEL